jgi:hypothetical protein
MRVSPGDLKKSTVIIIFLLLRVEPIIKPPPAGSAQSSDRLPFRYRMPHTLQPEGCRSCGTA